MPPDRFPDFMTSDYQQKFKKIFQEHYSKIVFYAMSFLHDEERSKGVAQEVFASVWENIEKLDDEVLPYLFVLTKRRCLNDIRKIKYKEEHKNHVTSSAVDREIGYIALKDSCIETLLESEMQKRFEQTLEQMPDKTKEAFCLNRFEEKTYTEIADIQGVSVKNIEYRIMCALRILRKNLQEFLPLLLGLLGFGVLL